MFLSEGKNREKIQASLIIGNMHTKLLGQVLPLNNSE